ncbi:MAG: hypothetical protein IT534_10745 [Bauldia sp.]|nr:hypothetical protein [Bauldia sp.]
MTGTITIIERVSRRRRDSVTTLLHPHYPVIAGLDRQPMMALDAGDR